MKDWGGASVDLIHDLSLMDLYAEGAPVAITVDEWGNEWEALTGAGIDYLIVED